MDSKIMDVKMKDEKSSEMAPPNAKWNTKNLIPRLATDATAAFASAVTVAPLITIIDKAIMENASGRAPIKESLKASFRSLILSPKSMFFSKPFGLICMLYGGTYLTANTLDTITSTVTAKDATLVTAGPLKFAASSTANIGLCLIKDRKFAQLFGPSGPPRPVPLPTMLLFATRDCMTIFASFNIPPLIGPSMSRHMGELEETISAQTIAQFAAPAAIQLLSTPMHLLGLDLYNRPHGEGWRSRASIIWKNWGVSSVARVCRIVPAFGVGGVINKNVRSKGMAMWM
ncbi:hypothetical protein VE03_07704 [Pseudogymnoascus sp. 23342-1-I1]|nr:hypothetical protein VE03_07704 [Pseudogymnoascus sp. 23342-1-I1]